MVFKTDRQRKGFFASRGNVRSNVNPQFVLSGGIGRNRENIKVFDTRKKAEKFKSKLDKFAKESAILQPVRFRNLKITKV